MFAFIYLVLLCEKRVVGISLYHPPTHLPLRNMKMAPYTHFVSILSPKEKEKKNLQES